MTAFIIKASAQTRLVARAIIIVQGCRGYRLYGILPADQVCILREAAMAKL